MLSRFRTYLLFPFLPSYASRTRLQKIISKLDQYKHIFYTISKRKQMIKKVKKKSIDKKNTSR